MKWARGKGRESVERPDAFFIQTPPGESKLNYIYREQILHVYNMYNN